MGAFSDWAAPERLEAAPLGVGAAPSNLCIQLTAGVGVLYAAADRGTSRGALPAPSLTLPDGRMSLGTHLPLLGGRYRYVSTLGEGVSAQVLLAEDSLAPGRLVAIKAMRRQYMQARGIGGRGKRLWQRLYPRLLDFIADSAALPPPACLRALRKLAAQLLGTLAHAHGAGVVHADLKPDNVLLLHPPGSPSMAIRLADFGSAFSVTETDTRAAVLGLPYGPAIDIWSAGVLLAEVALRRPLLPCHSPLELLEAMAGSLGPLPPGLAAASPLGRQALLHPFLGELLPLRCIFPSLQVLAGQPAEEQQLQRQRRRQQQSPEQPQEQQQQQQQKPEARPVLVQPTPHAAKQPQSGFQLTRESSRSAANTQVVIQPRMQAAVPPPLLAGALPPAGSTLLQHRPESGLGALPSGAREQRPAPASSEQRQQHPPREQACDAKPAVPPSLRLERPAAAGSGGAPETAALGQSLEEERKGGRWEESAGVEQPPQRQKEFLPPQRRHGAQQTRHTEQQAAAALAPLRQATSRERPTAPPRQKPGRGQEQHRAGESPYEGAYALDDTPGRRPRAHAAHATVRATIAAQQQQVPQGSVAHSVAGTGGAPREQATRQVPAGTAKAAHTGSNTPRRHSTAKAAHTDLPPALGAAAQAEEAAAAGAGVLLGRSEEPQAAAKRRKGRPSTAALAAAMARAAAGQQPRAPLAAAPPSTGALAAAAELRRQAQAQDQRREELQPPRPAWEEPPWMEGLDQELEEDLGSRLAQRTAAGGTPHKQQQQQQQHRASREGGAGAGPQQARREPGVSAERPQEGGGAAKQHPLWWVPLELKRLSATPRKGKRPAASVAGGGEGQPAAGVGQRQQQQGSGSGGSGSEGEAPGTAKRPRRDKKAGDKPWWMA
eukprot:scaffold14.g1084.t1